MAATAGCLGSVFGDSGEVVLSEQEDGYDSDSLPYPNYSEPFPEIELPDPIAETTVSTAESPLEDETLLVTAFYAFCPSQCLLLIRALAEVQSKLLEAGVEDVTILAITFDPERDTAAKLREYADRMNVDLEAGNWHYLRRDGGTESAYEFTHQTITFLVNPDRYVERVYHDDGPDSDRVSSDAETVAAAYR
jgi:protein SCO1/2